MAPSNICPKCKFPVSSSESECRLCGDSLTNPTPPALREGGKTAVWNKDHAQNITALASVQAFFDEEDDGHLPSPAAPPPRPPADEILAWISCPPLPPIPLRKDMDELSVGRVKTNDLMLPHHGVSRRHCSFQRSGTELTLNDLSSNGSFLNGKRIKSVTVRVGDVITVGPYDLELVAQYPLEDDGGGNTAEIDFASVTSGMIEGSSLAEMLQGLEFNQKTGTLKILAGRLRGLLVVRAGQAQFASFGDQHDEPAVLDMLDLAFGRYTFFGAAEPGQRTITSTLTAILFEHSRRTDESDQTN